MDDINKQLENYDRRLAQLIRESNELQTRSIELDREQAAAIRTGVDHDGYATRQAIFQIEMRQRQIASELAGIRSRVETTARAASGAAEYQRFVSQWEADKKSADRRALEAYESAPRDPYTRAVAEYRAQHGLT